jgi:hypothetical protein
MGIDMSNMIGVQGNAQGVNFLGRVGCFSISTSLCLPEDKVKEEAKAAGLPDDLWRNMRGKADAFRIATHAANQTGIPLGDNTLRLLVRDVVTSGSSDRLVRHLVREIVNKQQEKLVYKPVISFEFDGDQLTIQPLPEVSAADLLPEEQKAMAEVQEAFNNALSNLDARFIRSMVDGLLGKMQPTSLRASGGVYFVPEQYKQDLECLAKFVAGLGKYASGTDFWTMPVVDDLDRRVTVEKAVEATVVAESEHLIKQMDELLKQTDSGNRKVSQPVAVRYVNEVKRLHEMATEYKSLLERQRLEAEGKLEVAAEMARRVFDRLSV